MKKVISNFLKFILSRKTYKNRRENIWFIRYSNLELFFKTLKLRINYVKYFFLPSRHLGAIYLLELLSNIFKKEKVKFFLWDASLLGAARNQGAIAGSASDIDIAMIFNKKKHLKFILSLKKHFKLRFHYDYSTVQLFHELGLVDIALFQRRGANYQATVEIPLKKKINNDKTKKLSFQTKNFFPFKFKKIYSKKYLIPNNYQFIADKIYGPDWKIPDKKKQVYLNL